MSSDASSEEVLDFDVAAWDAAQELHASSPAPASPQTKAVLGPLVQSSPARLPPQGPAEGAHPPGSRAKARAQALRGALPQGAGYGVAAVPPGPPGKPAASSSSSPEPPASWVVENLVLGVQNLAIGPPPVPLDPVEPRPPALCSPQGGVGEARLERAREAGREARRKLLGERRTVASTPPLPAGSSRSKRPYYVLIRARSPLVAAGYIRSYNELAKLVSHPDSRHLEKEAVFHRFETWEEAEEYWRLAWLGTKPLVPLSGNHLS